MADDAKAPIPFPRPIATRPAIKGRQGTSHNGGGGRRAYDFSDQDRQLVQVLMANGVSEEQIARNFGISKRTLHKHCAQELKWGKDKVIAALGASVVRAGLAGDWRAAMVWLARHGGPAWQAPPGTVRPSNLGDEEALVGDQVVIYLPDNNRDKEPPTITVEPDDDGAD